MRVPSDKNASAIRQERNHIRAVAYSQDGLSSYTSERQRNIGAAHINIVDADNRNLLTPDMGIFEHSDAIRANCGSKSWITAPIVVVPHNRDRTKPCAEPTEWRSGTCSIESATRHHLVADKIAGDQH